MIRPRIGMSPLTTRSLRLITLLGKATTDLYCSCISLYLFFSRLRLAFWLSTTLRAHILKMLQAMLNFYINEKRIFIGATTAQEEQWQEGGLHLRRA